MPTVFPQPTQPPFVLMNALGIGLIAVVLGVVVFLLWPKRKGQVWDGAAILAFGVLATIVFLLLAPSHVEVEERARQWATWSWCVIGFALFLSFWRVLGWDESWKWLGLTIGLAIPLACLFLPQLEGRETSRFVQCKINLQQIGLALMNYQHAERVLPQPKMGDPPHSWRVALLPFIDQKPLYDRYRQDHAWDSPENEEPAKTLVPTYMCPSYTWDWQQDSRKPTCYALLTGPNAFWTPDGPRKWDLAPHGASNTAMVVEACGQNIVWTEPRDIDVETTPVAINTPGTGKYDSPAMFSSHHHRGVNVLLTDGSVRRIPLHTSPSV